MAKYPSISQIKNGRILIAKSNATGKALKPIKVVAGDGKLTNQNIETMENVINPLLELPFASPGRFVKEGQFQLDFALSNEHLEHGFYAREIGVFAKLDGEDDSTAVMIAYTNGGDFVDYIPAKDTPINSKVFELTIAVDNAANVIVQRSDAAYITAGEMERHNESEQAHDNRFNAIIQQVNNMITKSDIKVITGEVANGGTIPLPAGFLESECKWFAGIKHSNVNEWRMDISESNRSNLLAPICTVSGRVVTVGTQVAGIDGGSYTEDGAVNFGSRWARAFMPGTAWYMCIGIHG